MSSTPASAPARTATIELCKEAFKFSAGHFTIFSATRRERLHGHNFSVGCAVTGEVSSDGLIADYRLYKQRIQAMCDRWNEVLLLPGRSTHLELRVDDDDVVARFAGRRMILPREDVIILPVANITLEELSWLMLDGLVADAQALAEHRIVAIEMRVGSGPGQWAVSRWARADGAESLAG